MSNPDFKIEEYFCLDEMTVCYKVLRLSLTGEYFFVKKFSDLDAAKSCVRLLRKYNRGSIYHLVD